MKGYFFEEQSHNYINTGASNKAHYSAYEISCFHLNVFRSFFLESKFYSILLNF